MNTTRQEPIGEMILPRERSAKQIIEYLEGEKKLPLISIHGPSGVGKSDLAGPMLVQELRDLSGKSTPKLLRVPISRDDSALDVALRVTDLIIDHHAEFRSRKAASVFREKILRSVRRCPAEAAERLRTMMRSSEKTKYDVKRIQLVICLDGVDRLFESRARCGGDLSKAGICGEVNDPVGYLNKLIGMKTILFTIVHRSWVSRDVRGILENGGIDKSRRMDLLVSYPNNEEVESIVTNLLAPIKDQNPGQKNQLDEYGDLLADTMRKNPPLIGLLPSVLEKAFRDMNGEFTRIENCVERYLSNNGLLGDLTHKADEIYLQQNANNKLALEEVFSNLIKGGGRLLIKDAVMSDELWSIALNFVENRILAIDGRSYRDARFITTHKGLLTNWTRAANWTGDHKSVGITQLRSLDDRALSWQLADKNKALLIHQEEVKEDARLILRDSELSSQLSPLTREFLTKSLKPKKSVKKILLSKKVWVPVATLFGLFFLFCVVLVVIPDPGAPQVEQKKLSPTEVAETSAKEETIESFSEDLEPAVETGRSPILDEIKIEPMTDELLASAEKLSESSEQITDEIVLLLEEDLMPISDSLLVSEVVKEEFIPAGPVPTELEVLKHVEQVTSGISTAERKMPFALPSAQAHFEKNIIHTPKVTEQKEVPAEALESAVGHVENPELELPADDSKRLYEGLSNRRLEVGGAETDIVTLTRESSWREILNSMGGGIASDDMGQVLDSLKLFHEKTVTYPDEIGNLQVSEFKDLTSHLGKVALVQQDRVAMKGAWKLELVSQNIVELNTNVRMLMARLASNAGRDQEAVAYLAQTEIPKEINQSSVDFMKAAVGWHFNESRKAAESFRRLLPPQASID